VGGSRWSVQRLALLGDAAMFDSHGGPSTAQLS